MVFRLKQILFFDVDVFRIHIGQKVRNQKPGLIKRLWIVFSFDESKTLGKLVDMLDFLNPLYIKEGKARSLLAIGCTGGNHRLRWLLPSHLKSISAAVGIMFPLIIEI